MPEVELKLAVHGPFDLPELSSVDGIAEVAEAGPQHLRATYYDTDDLRLARNGITLRYRSGEEPGPTWTVKLPVDGVSNKVSAREEINVEGGGSTVPRGAADLVTAFARSAPLTPITRIHTRRRRWNLMSDEGVVGTELVDDEVSVTEGSRVVARFRELEIEDKGAGGDTLEKVGDALRAAGAMSGDQTPKAVRALGARATAAPDVVPPKKISPKEPAGHAVAASLAAGTLRLMVNDPHTRLGDEDAVHQMRVAARRMRSDLRTFGPLVEEGWAESLVVELKWVADALGEVRDLDVMQGRLRKAGGGMEDSLGPLFESMDVKHDVARDRLIGALRSSRYTDLLDRLVEAGRTPVLTEAAAEPCAEVLPRLVNEAWRKLARRARSLRPGDPNEDFHRVRILAKRARYAGEAVAPSLGKKVGRQASAFASGCADVQDVLGTLQDAVVSAGMVKHLATEHRIDGPFNLALGRLLERQEHNAREARQKFPKVWGSLDKTKNLSWLDR
ncbi:MAG: CHAD domain-containing protein [Actinomycetota bacterium]